MGKKLKTGKQRKDKFYHLAKEAGYRSRAAFKLIQLNRKFEFLQRARVLVDLCAAPGGWMQVANKYMPVSSLILGVDLVSIRPVANCITLQEDITTAKCRQSLRKELKTWKADVFLHDGAPNVGKSWVHDAFAQATLTLHALKLATEFLIKGGWFITKVFRSKDYHALLWVLNKLFKKVHATKPQASRHESAEIFVVCQYYTAPDKLDPKFLDPTYVFEEAEKDMDERPTLGQNDKKKPKAEGYPVGDYTLFHKVAATEFIKSNNHIQLLNDNNEIWIDDEEIADHPSTTREVLACCKDIKVLGKAELKTLLNWRKKLRSILVKEDQKDETAAEIVEVETEEDAIARRIAEVKATEARELRQKKKKVAKERRKIREKMDLKMNLGSDELMLGEDIELFRMSHLTSKRQLDSVHEQDASVVLSDQEDKDDDEEINPRKRKWLHYDKEETPGVWDAYGKTTGGESDDDSDSDHLSVSEDEDLGQEDEKDKDQDDHNPLVVDLENTKQRLAAKWFESDKFAAIENDSDEDLEVEMMADVFEKKKNATRVKDNEDESPKKRVRFKIGDDSSSEEEEDVKVEPKPSKKVSKIKKKKLNLGPEGLALGTLMIQSKKTKRDIVDNAYNRYSNNDDNLPDWFVQDEEKHNRKIIPVTAEMMREYRDRLKEINARPIKKVVEAKARKRKRAQRVLEKARKKAEAVTQSLDMSIAEQGQKIKAIYKRANRNKKEKEVTYVVAKKGVGKRVRRPPGVKGRFKVVDKRLKKDDRKRKNAEKAASKGKNKNRGRKNPQKASKKGKKK